MRFHPSGSARLSEFNHNHGPDGRFASGPSGPADSGKSGGPAHPGAETWKPHPDAKFKTGDRVKYSDYALRSYRDGVQKAGTYEAKNRAQGWLDEQAGRRGTVIGAGHNGYALGASVQWDNGIGSNTAQHMLAHDLLAPVAPWAATSDGSPAGEWINKHPINDQLHLDAAYTQRYKTAPNSKWNISSRDVLTDPTLMKRVAPFSTMTGAAHKNIAAHFDNAAQWASQQHQALVRSAEQRFGDHGSLIAGGLRDHWPSEVKDTVRRYAHATTAYRDAANAHRKAYLSARRRFREDGNSLSNPSFFIEKGFAKAAPGEGGRFRACVAKVGAEKGVDDPAAVCAAIGRRKYGNKGMGQMAAAGRQAEADVQEGAGKVHTDKFDRCVSEVQAKGNVDSAYAICQAALGKGAIRPEHRRTV